MFYPGGLVSIKITEDDAKKQKQIFLCALQMSRDKARDVRDYVGDQRYFKNYNSTEIVTVHLTGYR